MASPYKMYITVILLAFFAGFVAICVTNEHCNAAQHVSPIVPKRPINSRCVLDWLCCADDGCRPVYRLLFHFVISLCSVLHQLCKASPDLLLGVVVMLLGGYTAFVCISRRFELPSLASLHPPSPFGALLAAIRCEFCVIESVCSLFRV